MPPTSVTIKYGAGPSFVVRVGDRVVQESSTGDRPDTLCVRTVAKLCGGDVRQWIVLDSGEEYGSDGFSRRRSSGAYPRPIRAYSDALMAENAAAHVDYKERCAVTFECQMALRRISGWVGLSGRNAPTTEQIRAVLAWADTCPVQVAR
jgi:hypothetical protein